MAVEKEYEDFRDGLSNSLKVTSSWRRENHSAALRELTGTRIDATPEVIAVSPFFSRAHDRFVIARTYEQVGNRSEARKWYASLIEGYDFMYASAAQARLDALGK